MINEHQSILECFAKEEHNTQRTFAGDVIPEHHQRVRKYIKADCPQCGFRNCHCGKCNTNIAIFYALYHNKYWETRIKP